MSEIEEMKKIYEEMESLKEFKKITGVSLGKPSNSPLDDPNFKDNLKIMFNNSNNSNNTFTYTDYSDAAGDFEEKEKLGKPRQTGK